MRLPFRSNLTYASRLFRPTVDRPMNTEPLDPLICRSLKLMLDQGIIQRAPAGAGFFHWMPTGLLSLNRLITLIDRKMRDIGGQRLDMSSVCSQRQLEATERWTTMCDNLFVIQV